MTTDDMKRELEANGYVFPDENHSQYASFEWQPDNRSKARIVVFNDTFLNRQDFQEHVTRTAYAHLQQQRELAALRDYVKQIHHAGKLLPPTLNVSPDSPIGQIARVVWRSFAYLERFNITADESDET